MGLSMAFARAHVVGAGLAGLNAATLLAQAGLAVSLSDSAARAGGRCRSYFDPSLGLTIDNGNHLVLASNPAVKAFRERIGAHEPLAGPKHADFAFADLGTGERWNLRINDGAIPWWVAVPSRRIPGTGIADYLPLGKLLLGKGEQTIGDLIATKGPVWDRMLAPVLLAVLNTDVASSSAVLAANVLKETLAKGGLASAPRIAMPTLGAAFIDPAIAWLGGKGCDLATGRRLKAIKTEANRVSALVWNDGEEDVAPDAAVVLAVPAWVAGDLVPGLTVPDDHRAIVNAHFACQPPKGAPEMLGLINATSEWLFTHPDRVSVTISAADRLVDTPREELARTIWAEVAQALGLPADTPLPPWQIVKEKRATFAATPAQERLRPKQHTAFTNLFLAGDWVDTGLPATIEGALRSGDTAARLVLGQRLVYGRG